MKSASLLLEGLAVAVAWGAAAGQPELRFYAPFDGSPRSVAGIRAAPLAARRLEYAPGIRGKALKMSGAGAMLCYAIAGNLSLKRGTITFWYRPLWETPSREKIPIRSLFSTDRPSAKRGSGDLTIFAWSTNVRADINAVPDRKKGLNLLEPGRWSHVALTWENNDYTLYVDGVAAAAGRAHDARNLMLRPGVTFPHPARPADFARIKNFYIGSDAPGNRAAADGLIDEFKIYDGPLSAAAVAAEAARIRPLYATRSLRRYVLAERSGERLRFEVVNSGTRPETFRWECVDAAGHTVAAAPEPLTVEPGGRLRVEPELQAAAGRGWFRVLSPAGTEVLRREFWSIPARNPMLSDSPGFRLEPLFTLRPAELTGDPDRFAAIGRWRVGELAGSRYLEAGPERCDRFAVRMKLPESGVPYLIEVDYPDDCKRTADLVFQPSGSNGSAFDMQVGYLTGGSRPLSGRFVTSSRIYWAPDTDVTMIAMSARSGTPAAVAEVRVSRVLGGLPDRHTRGAAPVEGRRRIVGMNFEDPSLCSGFGVDPFSPAGGMMIADRLSAYMRFSGQEALIYPLWFYGGRIGEEYTGRSHAPGFAWLWCKRFESLDLDFYAALNLYSMQGYDLNPPREKLGSGAYHATAFSVLDTGDPSTRGLHREPPLFNFMHPETVNYVKAALDDVCDELGDSPAFKGVVLNISPRSFLSFGSIHAGYNDYVVAAFERDTGIRVPVDRADPRRGELYARWLLEHAREQWLDWRCLQVTKFHRELAEHLQTRRPDLTLTVNPRFSYERFLRDPEFMIPGYQTRKLREAGFDPRLGGDQPNLAFMHTVFPVAARHREGMGEPAAALARAEQLEQTPEYYEILKGARRILIHQHDIYWESRVGGGHKPNMDSREKDAPNPLRTPWLRETVWRVGVLNPAGREVLRPYVLPLRFGDLLGATRGGFLIGTHGSEPEIAEFSRVFRALPAQEFADEWAPSGDIRIRRFSGDGMEWRYIVNTGSRELEAELDFPTPAFTVPEGEAVAPGRHRLRLKPYELRAFRRPVPPAAS